VSRLARKTVLKAVIFDLDGTLVSSFYDWGLIRNKIGVRDLPILTYIDSLKKPLKQRAFKILESFEVKATKNAGLRPGIRKVLSIISNKKLKKAIVTNNSIKNVNYLLKKFKISFDVIITRDDGVWKPSAEPLLMAIKQMELKKDEVLFVGDSNPDIIASRKAGIKFFSLSEKSWVSDLLDLINESA